MELRNSYQSATSPIFTVIAKIWFQPWSIFTWGWRRESRGRAGVLGGEAEVVGGIPVGTASLKGGGGGHGNFVAVGGLDGAGEGYVGFSLTRVSLLLPFILSFTVTGDFITGASFGFWLRALEEDIVVFVLLLVLLTCDLTASVIKQYVYTYHIVQHRW